MLCRQWQDNCSFFGFEAIIKDTDQTFCYKPLLFVLKQYENVMFTNRGSGRDKLEIKLIDFGLSMKYGKSKGKIDMSKNMTDFVGTIYTMAPEVIRGNYT